MTHGLAGSIKNVHFIPGSIGRSWRGIGFSRSNSNTDEDFRRTVGVREHDLGLRWCRRKRNVHVLGSYVEGKFYVDELHVQGTQRGFAGCWMYIELYSVVF